MPATGRRILLVSYHFGPGCATGGVRWNALAAHLAEGGWKVEVITAVRPGASEPYEFRPGVRVIPVKVPTWLGDSIGAVSRLKRRLGGKRAAAEAPLPPSSNNSGPDQPRVIHRLYGRLMANLDSASLWNAEAGWARRAAKVGIGLGQRHPPSVVISSTPPHPTHLAGVRIAEALQVPYVADFRDPWVFAAWDAAMSTLINFRLSLRAQRRVFRAATRIVLNTTWATVAAEDYAPHLVGRTATVPNGYDLRAPIGTPDTDLFRVAFVGWLYEYMDPDPVLAACSRLLARKRLDTLRVQFVGTAGAPGSSDLEARAHAHGLHSVFEHRPRVLREEALRVQERAAVQIVFDSPAPLRIPMKFYDGLQMRGDLLLIGAEKSALAEAAGKVGLRVCRPDDPDALFDRAHAARTLQRLLEEVIRP